MSEALVEVELYGLPRLYAGASRCSVAAGSLRAVLRAVQAALPGLGPAMIVDGAPTEHLLVALDGREMLVDLDAAIGDGAVLVLVSAQAGG
ncbi:MAG: MoaD/ThiS family protein [Nannocystis sp.]|nr:MoaD/ThiS family protein [Nannocystis sp.]